MMSIANRENRVSAWKGKLKHFHEKLLQSSIDKRSKRKNIQSNKGNSNFNLLIFISGFYYYVKLAVWVSFCYAFCFITRYVPSS